MSAMNMTRRALGAAAIGAELAAGAALAQQPPACALPAPSKASTAVCWRSNPTSSASGEGGLADKARVFGVSQGHDRRHQARRLYRRRRMPQADGSQRAIQVTVFAEVQRGLGEGFRPGMPAEQHHDQWRGEQTVASVDGPVLTVKYKGGEQKIVVPPRRASSWLMRSATRPSSSRARMSRSSAR